MKPLESGKLNWIGSIRKKDLNCRDKWVAIQNNADKGIQRRRIGINNHFICYKGKKEDKKNVKCKSTGS